MVAPLVIAGVIVGLKIIDSILEDRKKKRSSQDS